MSEVRSARLHVVGAAIAEGGRVLVTQRGPGMSLASKWEFPGGKVEPGEAAGDALAREIHEELGLEIEVLEPLGSSETPFGDRIVELVVYAARVVAGHLAPIEHSDYCWCRPHELSGFDWAEADRPLLGDVARWLSDGAGSGDTGVRSGGGA